LKKGKPGMNDPIVLATRQTFSGVSSVSTPVDISNWTQGADWSLFLLVASCFNGVVTVALTDSQDGFAEDIQEIVSLNLTGPLNAPCDLATSWRKRELPSFRVGELGATCRVSVTSASSQASVTLSCEIK
jgi:hypothetical protein